jgi:hypothetical protein
MSKRKAIKPLPSRTKRAGQHIGSTLKTLGEGVQFFARGIKFWAQTVTSFVGDFKDGVKEGRRG